MDSLFVINDLHIGVQRTAGTTMTSAWELRQFVLSEYKRLLSLAKGDLIINGDLFDGYSINYTDLLAAFHSTKDWLQNGHRLILSAGNHDLSTNSTKLSSFEFFADLLVGLYPSRVTVIKGSKDIGNGCYVISHVPNQDLFNLELGKVSDDCKFLFLHCNFDNHFAVQSDHSLNLSEQQALAICKNGTRIILGHEHQSKFVELADSCVQIVGNQIPTSIADCLGNVAKTMLHITDSGILPICTWEAVGDFAQVDWQELSAFSGAHRFIRVVGEAAAPQAADVVSAISKFRSKSTAFVVTNAVKLLGDEGEIEFSESAETLKAFDVLSALLEMLTVEEAAVVKSVLEANHD